MFSSVVGFEIFGDAGTSSSSKSNSLAVVGDSGGPPFYESGEKIVGQESLGQGILTYRLLGLCHDL